MSVSIDFLGNNKERFYIQIDVSLDVLERFRLSFLQLSEFMDYSVQRQTNNGTRGNSDRRTYITTNLINITIINVSEMVLSSRINFSRHYYQWSMRHFLFFE